MKREIEKQKREISDYKFALDQASIVAITNTKGIIVDANDNFCTISKYSREELIGQDHRIINSGYHPKEFIRDLWVTIANGKVWKGEIKNKAKDGTFYWVDTTIVPFLDDQGKPFQFIAITSDITTRKEKEEKLKITQTYLQSSIESYKDIFLFSIDTQFNYLVFNSAFKAATKYAYGTEVVEGMSLFDSITIDEDKIKAKVNCEKALTGESHTTLEVYGDINRSYYETTYSPILSQNGETIGVTVLSANVTERKKAEEQLQEANKELESFSYSVAHDLRTPLRSLHGYAEMLSQDYENVLDEEAKRIIGNIKYNASKMGRLIDDLLSFSRLGRKEVQLRKINMSELTKDVVNEINKSVSHKADIHIDSLHEVMADYSLLFQVMVNLLSNAIKYSSKREKPIIQISSEAKNDEIIFSVKDNGAGFDMKYISKLFSVFQRLHTEREFEGTGVGLAIVHRIITKHGGKIWAEGKVDNGATFYFTLLKNQQKNNYEKQRN
ncbi:MAG: ATP-binding protein [Bacteroidia bacterium]